MDLQLFGHCLFVHWRVAPQGRSPAGAGGAHEKRDFSSKSPTDCLKTNQIARQCVEKSSFSCAPRIKKNKSTRIRKTGLFRQKVLHIASKRNKWQDNVSKSPVFRVPSRMDPGVVQRCRRSQSSLLAELRQTFLRKVLRHSLLFVCAPAGRPAGPPSRRCGILSKWTKKKHLIYLFTLSCTEHIAATPAPTIVAGMVKGAKSANINPPKPPAVPPAIIPSATLVPNSVLDL